MTFGSLFSGIGGMDLGLERAGMVCRWQCEIDPYACRVLAKHWPEVPRYGDIRELDDRLERVDLLAGGFPCQPTSLAGRRRGAADERWLWPEFARLVGEIRPRYVLVENPPGLLTLGMGSVLGDLSALGYDAEWQTLPAAAFGAPHLRSRVWLAAYPAGLDLPCPAEPARPPDPAAVPLRAGPLGRDPRVPAAGRAPGDAPGRGRGPGRTVFPDPRAFESAALRTDRWAAVPPLRGVAHGVPRRVDRVRGLGDACVPQVVEWIARRIMAAAGEAGDA